MKFAASIVAVVVILCGCSNEPESKPKAPRGQADLANPDKTESLDAKQLAAIQAIQDDYRRIFEIIECDRSPDLLKRRGDPGSQERTEDIILRVTLTGINTGTLGGDRIKVVSCLIASGHEGADSLGAYRLRYFAMWYGLKANELGLGSRDGFAYFNSTLWPDIRWREEMLQDWKQWKAANPEPFTYGVCEALFTLRARPDGAKQMAALLGPTPPPSN